MAGEQKGKAYEALTKLVLEDLKAEGKIRGRIFWEEKPETMTIVPDITIGRSANAPDIFLLVTHSGAAGNSHMKYWRNMGELVEEKVFLPKPAKVFNLAFDSVIKENLKEVQAASFDGQLLVGDRPYGDRLQTWIDKKLKGLPKEKDAKVEHLRGLLKSDKELKRLYALFKRDVEALLKKKAPKELDAIWEMERKRKKGTAPQRKVTFVRRGLSKLLIFENVDVALRLYSGKRVKQEEIPQYAYDLGLATKAIGKAQPADEEVGAVVRLLGSARVSEVVRDAPIAALGIWLSLLRNVSTLKAARDFIVAKWDEIRDPAKLFHWLKRCADDPTSVAPQVNGLETNWLFYFLLDVIKANSKLGQGFGYAQMLRLMRRKKAALNAFLRSLGLGALDTSRNSFLDRGLRDWANCRDTAQARGFPLRNIAAVAFAISDALDEIPVDGVPSFAVIRERIVQTALEQKLVTYRDFQPLRSLILSAVTGKLHKMPACFATRSGIKGLGGETTVLLSKSTLIDWQSCSDAGRDHKKKELCGRAVALRYSWDFKAKKFIPRPGIKKLILVVDGTWTQSDLDALVRAGWDEIFYPDQMDELAKAIV